MSKYYYNKDYFANIESENQAYWLGFLYADGCINRYYKNDRLKSMNIELSVCEKDYNHLKKFINDLNSNVELHKKITKLNGKEYISYKVNICCTKMCYDLIKLGCTPQKTYAIQFPTYDIVPQKFMKDFIRGFFDGDGCISITEMNKKPHIVLSITGMSTMLQSIVDFLFSEKIITNKPQIYKDNRREYTYNVYFHGNDSIKYLLDYLYKDSTVYLDRKYDAYMNYYKNYQDINKRGIYWDKNVKKYIVSICINGNKIRIEQYDDLQLAIMARKEAEIKKYENNNCRLN